jgi:peptidoglycan/xylan/chitin deacetylase (PgdA/CDA1 family)
MKTKDPKKPLIVCITGDIDYFDTESIECLDRYFSVLEKYDIQGTFFITAKAAQEFPERVEHILKHNQVVEGHGDVHKSFYESVPIQTDRLKSMKKTFSALFDLDIQGFRAPDYEHNSNTYPAVENAGLTYDCSKVRFEIAFKAIPFVQKRYMYTKTYPFMKPALKCVAIAYNAYHHAPRVPYLITPNVVEFPTLGISDYTLIEEPPGPLFRPADTEKIGSIWIECLASQIAGGGGVMTIQAHPGRVSPAYVDALDYFIKNALQRGVTFSPPRKLRETFGS